jgi:CcmD family protein
MPALPLHEAGKYVAAAYIVVFALVLIYLAIMAAKLSRIERELGELAELASRRHAREREREQERAAAANAAAGRGGAAVQRGDEGGGPPVQRSGVTAQRSAAT